MKLAVAALLVILLTTWTEAVSQNQVLVAVNAGGPAHRDILGISYAADLGSDDGGIASDYGMRLDIQRVDPDDQILYQTERYGTEAEFGYRVPLRQDGEYVLVLKFCEVYFKEANQKVFNVVLNGQRVLSHLDIFARVGKATAHDEYVPFEVKDKGQNLLIYGKETVIKGGKVALQFEKGIADNPKINAFYIIKGSIKDVPTLPPLPPGIGEGSQEEIDHMFEDEDDEDVRFEDGDLGFENKRLQTFSTGMNKLIRSGPENQDPWEDQKESDKNLPLFVALITSAVSFVGIYFLMK